MKVYILFDAGDPDQEGEFIGVFSSENTVMEYVKENFTLNDPQPRRMIKDQILQITHLSQQDNERQFSSLYAYIRRVN